MNAIDVIKTELACVQRDCCRVENQCAKCDLVLPVEEIISAYEKCITLLSEHEKLENKIADIKANCDLAIEGRDVKIIELEQLLNQYVEDNTKVSNYITKLEQQIEEMKCCCNCDWSNYLPNGNCLDCDGKKNWKLKEIKEK